jgi:acetyl-CoA synthetase
MSDLKVYPVPIEVAAHAWINNDQYLSMYKNSIEDPEGFWMEQADRFISWYKRWDKVLDWDFTRGHVHWFAGAKLNVSYNCLDRHLETRGDQVAIIWEGDNPSEFKKITYFQLQIDVCKFANVLKILGVKRGDRVCIYMPMIPETAVAMLACARIGAIHSVVFGGFSPDSLKDRIMDAECNVVVTSDEGMRGGRQVPMKANVDKALRDIHSVKKVIVVKRTDSNINWIDDRDVWYHDVMATASSDCQPEHMDSEDPLFILYTSGSTGKPKGVLHTNGGYLLHTAITHKYVFDYHDGDIYWCTADVGWVTGHSYIIYGPLANGATSVMFEGIPTYPNASRFWEIVDKHKVNIFYTAPTAIRSLMREGEEPVKRTSRDSLRILGSVGEPINPEAWAWYYKYVGEERCPIVDTWWQTETGGILITPLPGATKLKPGSATRPFFGVRPALVDADGKFLEGPNDGNLVITYPWPGMMRTLYGDHQRFIETYFSMYKGLYCTGDGARRDEEGYYWITGRVDDVINVSGHRMGTAEVESALVLHAAVAEAAVVGYPHELKGQGIYAYVTLKTSVEPTEELRKQLVEHVRREIGPIASPDILQWAPGLPKTRSGKIMRRILRKIAASEIDQLGDISTLADPSVVIELVRNRISK